MQLKVKRRQVKYILIILLIILFIGPFLTFTNRLYAPVINCVPTSEDGVGPYYLAGAPERNNLAKEVEQTILIRGKILNKDCSPVANAKLDMWQAGPDGEYSKLPSYDYRGIFYTNDKGEYEVTTILPGRYASGNTYRPLHIHVTTTKPNGEIFTTQIYFSSDEYLPKNDPYYDSTKIVNLVNNQAEHNIVF